MYGLNALLADSMSRLTFLVESSEMWGLILTEWIEITKPESKSTLYKLETSLDSWYLESWRPLGLGGS